MAGRTFLLNTVKFKSLNKLRVALKHNLRENGRELYFSDKIDSQRKHLNVVLAGTGTAQTIMDLEKQLLVDGKVGRVKKDGGRAKVRADGVRAIEFLISLPPNSGVNEDKFFHSTLTWLERRYDVPILRAVVHRDESAGHPHMHVVVLPLRDGSMIGSSMLGLYSKLQADFHQQVAAQFGLRRALARPDVATRKAAAQAFMSALDERPELIKIPGIYAWIREIVERSPSRPLELAGLTMPSPRPVTKQWVETMTRPIKLRGVPRSR